MQSLYRIVENFGGAKPWRISKKLALAEKTLANCLKIRDWRGKTLANLLLSWKSTEA